MLGSVSCCFRCPLSRWFLTTCQLVCCLNLSLSVAVLWADYSSTTSKLLQYKAGITPVLHRSTPPAPLLSFVENGFVSHSLLLCRTPVSSCLFPVLSCCVLWVAAMQRRLYCWFTTFFGFAGILVSLPLGEGSGRGIGKGRPLYNNNVSTVLFVNLSENLYFFFKKVWEKFVGYL